mgnify:CR=1 FL=1
MASVHSTVNQLPLCTLIAPLTIYHLYISMCVFMYVFMYVFTATADFSAWNLGSSPWGEGVAILQSLLLFSFFFLSRCLLVYLLTYESGFFLQNFSRPTLVARGSFTCAKCILHMAMELWFIISSERSPPIVSSERSPPRPPP